MEGKIKAELVFIPSPGRGHLPAALEMAKLLVNRDQRLSVTVLLTQSSNDTKNSLGSYSRIRLVNLPQLEPPSNSTLQKHVRNEAAKLRNLVGFVVDIFCTSMIDVAHELGVPAYLFFTSGAATLGLLLHLQGLLDHENQDPTVFKSPNDEIFVPSYGSPFPVKFLPTMLLGDNQMAMDMARRIRRTKGIIVNTFSELEIPAMKFLSQDEKTPPVYPVGPVLHVDSVDDRNPIMKWLDDQPDSSVVFLCFGSNGFFDETQVREIALALENCGHRFLWSLRKPSGEYEDLSEVLPEGFIERTAGIGKVIGWAPQVDILSHRAVGGFVSHCGWNSTLESIWCGVPMAVWPLFGEQSVNAFQLVKDLGVAVEINMEYKKSSANMIVRADEIMNGIRRLMEPVSDIRVKVEALKVKSRMAVGENGSSFESIGRFISHVMVNINA
uniref:Glycosyltransferase n=1 Tax=Castilleja foliolosa TaxID=1961234 RepID=A0ABD3DZH9_9LAMI